MNQALTTVDKTAALPSIDLARPESLLSLPTWLNDRLSALSPWGEGIWQDGKNTPTIPASLMLTGPMRMALERRCEALERACQPGPEEKIAHDVAVLVARYVTGKSDESTVAVRIEWYVDALSDLPAWAVKEAIRRWRLGKCGPQNYDFAPAEAVLRSIAEGIAASARGQCVGLRRLLSAQPVEELDEETRAANRARLAKAMDDLVQELQAKAAQVREDERNFRAQKRADYQAMQHAASERRQAMDSTGGGHDEHDPDGEDIRGADHEPEGAARGARAEPA